jgi:nucleotide-binding universal stress UspA family protein
MAYKDILVYVDTAPQTAARLDIAAALAQQHQAQLIALYVDAPPFIPADVMGTGMSAEVMTWQRELRRSRAAEARAVVDAAQQRHGLEMEWRNVAGTIDETLLLHGRYADLIVIGQSGDPMNLSEPLSPSPAAIVVGAGRPVLVVPRAITAGPCGGRILIAWKATAEATRAVHDAEPLLARAGKVTVVAVSPEADEAPRIGGSDIARHLARHGIAVDVAPVIAPDLAAGPTILARAGDLQADLIVMGGYGHSRLREMVLGGVTRHVLQHMTVPVLMSC